MAKANRKRTNGIKAVKIKTKKVVPLGQREAQMLQGFANASVNYDKIMKQEQQYKFLLESLQKTRKQIQDGDITTINIPIAPNTTAPITDKKKMLEHIDDNVRTVHNALLGIKGQVEHKQDLFTEEGLKLKAWVDSRFGNIKPKDLTSSRKTTEDEKVLFEQAFDDLDAEEFDKAREKAITLNKEKAKKSE